MEFYPMLIARLLLAGILGGIIGYERESAHRPAGFRTHILVCVGSALVMITSEYIFKIYSGYANIDPARLGAQVISGIGFLGAGTIMREGFNVKGLTTAASLWAVACVGIAAGVGFYQGAVVAAVIIILTLITLKKVEDQFATKNLIRKIYIQASNSPGQIGTLSSVFDRKRIFIRSIEFINQEDDSNLLVRFTVRIPDRNTGVEIMNELHGIEGVRKVYEE